MIQLLAFDKKEPYSPRIFWLLQTEKGGIRSVEQFSVTCLVPNSNSFYLFDLYACRCG